MRVLLWSEMFLPAIGGVEVLGAHFSRALRARGHELIVVARQDDPRVPEYDEYSGVPVYRFPFRTILQTGDIEGQFRLRNALASLKRDFRPDLVHIFHSGPGVFFHIKTADAHPAPLLFSLHQTYDDFLLDDRSVRGRLLRSADWVTACSHSVLTYTRAQVAEITPRSSAILNSLEPSPLVPTQLSFDPPRLLCVGRVIHQKGFDLALVAFATLIDDFPRARLVIAGDGLARPALERQAAELGIAHAVDLVGWVAPDDVPALINRCTLVVMPSRIEPFGLVALQAAQMARPIVASRVDGLPEIVVAGETGLLVGVDDIDGLAAGIRSMLANPRRTAELGAAARQRARDVFDWGDHVSAYETLYRQLVQGSG